MYNYAAPDQTVTTGSGRMPESFSFDGIWIEDKIPGFFVTGVSGRELMEANLKTQDVGYQDGTHYLARRRPVRVISVNYVLIADSNSAFRAAYNTLNNLLSGEQKKLIFADEPDKYFVASKTGNSQVDTGRNAVSGLIEFTCTDPFKYSTAIKEATAAVDGDHLSAEITNEGSIPAVLSYQITHGSHDNGYIGIVSSNGGTMEFGDVNAVDKETVDQTVRVVTLQSFLNVSDNHTEKDWLHWYSPYINQDEAQYTAKTSTAGSCKTVTASGETLLGFGGRGTDTQAWPHSIGGMRVVTLPADATGSNLAKNFDLYLKPRLHSTSPLKMGELSVAAIDASNRLVLGICIYKVGYPGTKVACELYANNQLLKTVEVPFLDQNGAPFAPGQQNIRLSKHGGTIRFDIQSYYHLSYDFPELANTGAHHIQARVTAQGTCTVADMERSYGFAEIDLWRLGTAVWKDIPNRYPAKSVIEINGESGTFYVDKTPRPEDEVLGTQYFKAPPGKSQIEIYTSGFCAPKPEVKVRFREAWL